MGLKIETWTIAYRKRTDKLFCKSSPFTIIKNGYKGWYADPFLLDYNGKTYLFAENFSYKLGRGILVYAEYDEEKNEFTPYKEIITEDYHLSYPNVFEYNGKIYMMPESSEANSLILYEAVSFPDKWQKVSTVMENIKLVDTTPFVKDEKLYALTLKLNEQDHTKGELLLLEFDGEKFSISEQGILTDDMSKARPGGHFIEYKDKLYRIAQDCVGSYGKALNVIEVSSDFVNSFSEKTVERITPEDIKLTNGNLPSGIHTFNISNKLEVIDLKYYKNSIYHILVKFF